MTDADHSELLGALLDIKGYVVLSGYQSALYDSKLHGRERHETKARISARRGTGVRTEVVWINPACASARGKAQGKLFG